MHVFWRTYFRRFIPCLRQKKTLLICLLGSAVSFLLLAFAVEKGAMMGISSAVMVVTFAIGGLCAGLLNYFSDSLTIVVAAFAMVCAMLIMFRYNRGKISLK